MSGFRSVLMLSLGVGVASLAVRETSLKGVPEAGVLYSEKVDILCFSRCGVLGNVESIVEVVSIQE